MTPRVKAVAVWGVHTYEVRAPYYRTAGSALRAVVAGAAGFASTPRARACVCGGGPIRVFGGVAIERAYRRAAIAARRARRGLP